MTAEWRELPLEDCMAAIIDYRGKTPRKTTSGIPLVTAKIIKGGRIEKPSEFIDPTDYDEWMRRGIPAAGDIVLTTEAPLGEVAQLDGNKVALAQRVITLRAKEGIMDNTFLKFLMQSVYVQEQLKGRSTGTTVHGIRQSELRKVSLPVPPIGDQRAIAHILGTLDDKIDLNLKMNQTLEAMARAIFKSWFVDFDPVRAKAEGRDHGLPPDIAALFPGSFEGSDLGEIPKRWRIAQLEEIAEVIDCLHSKKPERSANGQPLLQLWNIRDNGLIDMADAFFISEVDYQKWISRMEALPGDCVITNVGRVGAVAQMPEGLRAALGRNMTGIRCKPPFSYPTFLIECLLSEAMRNEILMKKDAGTILDALNVRNIPKLRFILPYTELLSKFEETTRPMRARMERNLSEASTLAALRDALLPKLLSGEIRVKNAEKFVEAAI